jgi:hypothetical protein
MESEKFIACVDLVIPLFQAVVLDAIKALAMRSELTSIPHFTR